LAFQEKWRVKKERGGTTDGAGSETAQRKRTPVEGFTEGKRFLIHSGGQMI